jgi:hypothetical protein
MLLRFRQFVSIAGIVIAACVAGSAMAALAPPTEIVVVGTVHSRTANYSADDLLRILQQVKPDVVLFEYPPEMMTPAFEFPTIDADNLEQRATLAYVKQTGAKIRPYDVAGRNALYQETKYFDEQRRCNAELDASVSKGRLGAEARRVLSLLEAANARRDGIGQSGPRAINSFETDTAISEKQWLMGQGIPELVRVTPDLRGCEAFWNLSRAYWVRRNNEMVNNIRRLAREFAGRRLVVLCGYEHRYYLRSHLFDWERQPDYVVKEYWEY